MKCPTGKIPHASKKAALIVVSKMKSNLLNVFPCEQCKQWHIGRSRSPFRFQKRLDQLLARDAKRKVTA